MKRAAGGATIHQHIEQRREELRARRLQLPEMERRRALLEETRDALSARRHVRRRADLQLAIAQLAAEIEEVVADRPLAEFERSIVPFTEAYARCSGASRRRVGAPTLGRPAPHERPTQTQADIVALYLAEVHKEPLPASVEAADVCPSCSAAMVVVPARAMLACSACGRSATYLDATSSSLAYDDQLEMVTFTYKRGNHFQDWLTNCQGLEVYRVPQEVVETIMHELYRQRTELAQITTRKVREVLKTLRLRRYYDHAAQVTQRITGRASPRIPAEATELCRLMFTAIQGPFQRHCPPSRKNFLSYSFCLSKFLYILGYDELCETLTLLKGRDKLQKQDQVWRLIAQELDWEFFPTEC